jgi:hypothetical protein
MHFLSCFSPIDVFPLLHSFAFALHISHSPSPLSPYSALGSFAKTPKRPRIRIYAFLCRPVVSPWTFSSTSTTQTCYASTPTYKRHHHPSLDVPDLSCSSFDLFYIYNSRSAVPSSLCCPPSGVAMRAGGHLAT